MKAFRMLLVLAAGSLAAPSLAHAPNAAVQGAQKPKKEHKICRSEARSGSHMAKTVCKTATEWNAAGEEISSFTGNRDASGRDINLGTKGSAPPH